MSSPSNLYAEKVYAEHPLELWSLDDDINYLSLISESDRDLSTWSVTNGAAANATILDEPFPESFTTNVAGASPTGTSSFCEVKSPTVFSTLDLNTEMSTISISSYLYVESPYITSVEVGYEYYDENLNTYTDVLKYIPISTHGSWIFISEIFNVPDKYVSYKIILKFSYVAGEPTSTYSLYVNGLTVGQWAEEFQSSSLGGNVISIPSAIAVNNTLGIASKAYGFSELNAYHIIDDGRLLAKNTGIPMVYGASNVTKIYPHPNEGPSIIFPGLGVFNEAGKYRDSTVEFWLRLLQDSSAQQKIFGPIASSDGLYIRGPFLMLRINSQTSSYYVGEWARPMLVHIRFANDTFSVLINGEQVMSLNANPSQITFPDPTNQYNKDQDWLGFYSYDNFASFEIDCFAIYSYSVPAVVAKKRFVYGQGVEFPENINRSYSGTSMFVDYNFADYTNNYNYPQIGTWSQGLVDNLNIDNGRLQMSDYSLPELVFDNKTSSDWNESISDAQNEDLAFMTLRPNSDWDNTQGAIYFNNFNFISGGTQAFYVILKESEPIYSNKTVFAIYDQNNNYIKAQITGLAIEYIVKYGNSEPEVFASLGKFYPGEEFSVGLNLEAASNYFGGKVATILGKKSGLSLYVGNSKELNEIFDGNIYRVGFMNKRQSKTIQDSFAPNGLVWGYSAAGSFAWDSEFLESPSRDFDGGQYSTEIFAFVADGGAPGYYAQNQLINLIPSYGLYLSRFFTVYFLDILSYGYWEDQIPLSYFGQYVDDEFGNKYYDLDFLQFNVDYPAPSQYYAETEITGPWEYGELYAEYSNPIQRTYESLDNFLYTGYADYSDLANRTLKTYRYNTTSSMIKTYVTFQLLSSGANSDINSFTNTEPAPKNGVVRPTGSWLTTKYEVVDGMVIYPPSGVSFQEIAVVTHIEIVNPGINQFPIAVRSLQFASQALNNSYATPIGTRFGVPLYPFTRSGIYYDFKATNPFSIYKGSSPYLYLTRKSGIAPRGNYDPTVSRGLMTPMNQNKAPQYKVIAFQAAIRYDEDFFPYGQTEVMEIEAKDRLIKIYMAATHPEGKRAKLYAIDGNTGEVANDIVFYWNGRIVKEPALETKDWGMLGLGLSQAMDVGGTVGFVRITGPIMANSISHYQSTNLQEVQQVSSRPWFRVKQIDATEIEWDFWRQSYLWNGVLVISTKSFYGVSPEDIYKTYTGNNKIIVDDSQSLQFNSYEYIVIKDAAWQTQTVSPV
jgi:hypothetical protein